MAKIEEDCTGRLMEQVCTLEALESGYRKVKRNSKKGTKRRRDIENFGKHLEKRLTRLIKSLENGSYRPRPNRRQMIPKADGGARALGISEVQDQVVQTALNEALQPIFEPTFSECSYGFRKGRGAQKALNRVDELLDAGFAVVVDADIEKFFDRIPRQQLLDKVGEKVADVRVTKLIWGFLTAGYMQDGQFYLQELGTPQGSVISPLLANIFLTSLDRLIAAYEGYKLVRYADDFVIFSRTRAEAEAAKGLD
jgi:RNA-directed DNA polymerase